MNLPMLPPLNPLRFGAPISEDAFAEIRREMELAHCKWDAQVGDVSTLLPFPLLIHEAAWRELVALTEALARETVAIEEALLRRPDLHRALALPRLLRALFARRLAPTPAATRVLRFDFHWTTEGWRISEVNSDVPGGYTEATSFTRLVARSVYDTPSKIPHEQVPGDPTAALVEALARAGDGVIALTNAPGHMEDHQVVAYVAAALRARGRRAEIVAPSHLRWRDGRARVENAWCDAPAAAIFRFYQVEWLAKLPRAIEWQPLFFGARTPVANPGVAALTESKRLPLVWDRLPVPCPTWRRVLPETRALADAPWATDDGWVIKSAFSNTGDTVSMRDLLPAKEWRRRQWSARLRPGAWIAQRRFEVVPLASPDGPKDSARRLHPCIGVYAIDGRAAGAYARLSRGPVVDAFAHDAALLIEP